MGLGEWGVGGGMVYVCPCLRLCLRRCVSAALCVRVRVFAFTHELAREHNHTHMYTR